MGFPNTPEHKNSPELPIEDEVSVEHEKVPGDLTKVIAETREATVDPYSLPDGLVS